RSTLSARKGRGVDLAEHWECSRGWTACSTEHSECSKGLPRDLAEHSELPPGPRGRLSATTRRYGRIVLRRSRARGAGRSAWASGEVISCEEPDVVAGANACHVCRFVGVAVGRAGGGDRRPARDCACTAAAALSRDRKSTRLNSSHVQSSYAVVCLHTKQRQILVS